MTTKHNRHGYPAGPDEAAAIERGEIRAVRNLRTALDTLPEAEQRFIRFQNGTHFHLTRTRKHGEDRFHVIPCPLGTESAETAAQIVLAIGSEILNELSPHGTADEFPAAATPALLETMAPGEHRHVEYPQDWRFRISRREPSGYVVQLGELELDRADTERVMEAVRTGLDDAGIAADRERLPRLRTIN